MGDNHNPIDLDDDEAEPEPGPRFDGTRTYLNPLIGRGPADDDELSVKWLLHPALLEKAFLTSFGVHYIWLQKELFDNRIFPPGAITIVDYDGKYEYKLGKVFPHDAESGKHYTAVFPPRFRTAMDHKDNSRFEMGCMHSKLMVLVHKRPSGERWLRVAILSANLGGTIAVPARASPARALRAQPLLRPTVPPIRQATRTRTPTT